MGYCCVHINKLKTAGALAISYEHNQREIDVPNANPDLYSHNVELIDNKGKDYNDLVNEKISQMPYYFEHPVRKNAVRAIEVMLTFSHEDMEKLDKEQWQKDSLEWLRETFKDPTSGKDNVLAATAHYDESTPHIHAICCLEYNGKINTSPFIGGRKKMAELQSSYAKAMESYGLERGREFSRASHNDIGRFYSQLTKHIQDQPAPQPMENEDIHDYQMRVDEYAKDLKASYFRDLLKKDQELESIKNAPEFSVQKERQLSSLKRKEHKTQEFIREYGSYKEIEQKLSILDEIQDRAETFEDVQAQKALEYIREIQEEIKERDQEIEKQQKKNKHKRKARFRI